MNTKISFACLVSGFHSSPAANAPVRHLPPEEGGGGGGRHGGNCHLGRRSGNRWQCGRADAPGARIIPETPGRTPIQPGQPGSPTVNETATDTISTNPLNSGTNRLGMATNQMQGGTNSTAANDTPGNHAVTPSDRLLLNSLNQTVGTQLGVTSISAMPVHFLIANGAVTLVGTVPSADASQRILARVQQTPGVLNVFNDLTVGTAQKTAAQSSSIAGAATDHAFSPADKNLLTAVQQSAGSQLGINGASANQMPVHFSIENGVVGVTGQVTSLQEKQALIAAVQKTKGVIRVVDNVGVANGAAGGVDSPNGTANPFQNNGNLSPTSRDLNQTTNSNFLNSTNNSGFLTHLNKTQFVAENLEKPALERHRIVTLLPLRWSVTVVKAGNAKKDSGGG